MKAHTLRNKLIAGSALFCATLMPIVLAEGQKPKYSIKEVMKEIHKGDDNIGKRALKGEASKEDIARMVEYYQSLPLNDPPRGDKASWMEKTAVLVKAGNDLKAGLPGAVDTYKNAANCKACHTAHKPPQDQGKK